MDLERGSGNIEFSEKSIRHQFIRKVYGILSVQLIVTTGIVSIFVFSESVKDAIQKHPSIYWVPLVLSFVLIIVLACCENVRRKAPWNFVFLGLFTICEGITIGVVASTYNAWQVAISVFICVVVVAGLTAFAFQTKIDFTGLSGTLFAFLLVLFVFGIFAAIFNNQVLNILYASLGAFLFCLYIIMDTQLMMGGNHKVSISPEEYIFAALNLYLDVINLFLMILSLVGSGD